MSSGCTPGPPGEVAGGLSPVVSGRSYFADMAHVTFIHGIGNKPEPGALLDRWERALADGDGIDLGTRGITSSMVYWADVLYPEPVEAELESDSDLPVEETGAVDEGFREKLEGHERVWVDSFAADLGVDGEDPEPVETGATDSDLERVLLPRGIKQKLMKSLLRDVHHYLFNSPHAPRPGPEVLVRDEIRRRAVDALAAGAAQPGPHVVVSHSMGTVIAYDCLKRVPGCPPVDGLMTIGSPLGRHEIPDELQPQWTRDDGYPTERLGGRWVNVFDHFDPVVGVYPHLAFLYRRGGEPAVTDVNEENWGTWRHDIAKYLRGERLRAELAGLLDI